MTGAGDTTWTSASAVSGWTVSGTNVYETLNGNVGIGTSALQTALAITNGNVGIGTWTAAGGGLIVASGNVGIGSAWPGQPLDVNGAIRTTTTGGINFGTDNKALIQPSATTTPDLKFLTNSIEIMRITNGGNVGIGSTLPGQKLDVLGTIRTTALTMSGQTPISGYVLTASDSAGDTTWTSASAVSGWTVSGNNVYESLNGNVGIGTATPQGSLVVTNGSVGIGTWAPVAGVSLDVNGNIRVQGTNSLILGNDGKTGFTVSSAITGDIIGVTNSLERLRITNGGKIGINSSAPVQMLDVQGTIRTIGLTMSGQTPISGYVLTASDSAGDTTWTSAGAVSGWTVSGNNVYETLRGNVGIGTSALQTALAITNGNVGIGTWTAAGGNLIVNGGGNVGFGSAWPGTALDINGTARMTGFALSNNGASAGNVLVTNSVGVGTWMPASTLPGTGTAPGGGQGAVQYDNAAAFTGDATKFSFDGANIGIGTSGPHNKLDILGNIGIGTIANSLYLTSPAPNGGMIIEGNVGIGSLTPGQLLDVRGTVRTTALAMSGQTPISGYVLTASDSAGDTTWTSAGAVSGWTVSGNNVYETLNGNVGIGTSALQTALAITNGNVGIGTWTAAGGGLIVASGNVGIGSAWPGQALDVNGAIRTTTTGGINFGTDNKALIQPSATTTPDLKFLTNSIEIMRITNGGNVGIGSTLPGQKLDVLGTVRTTALTMSGQTPISGYVLTASDSAGDTTWTSAGAVSGWTVSGNNVYETNSGNVGIGTSALQTALAITNGNVGIGTWSAAGGNLIVNGGGNVGIGSAWPGTVLDINGTARMTGFTLSNNGASAGNVLVTNGVGVGTWMTATTLPGTISGLTPNFVTKASSATSITNSLLFDNGTNVGIGSINPSAALDVNGVIAIEGSGSSYFTSHVGIGSINPGQGLDVQGTVRTIGLTMSGQTPISGYVLTASDSAGDTTWTSAGAVSGWTVSGNNVYETLNGNVGIGTNLLTTSALTVMNGNVGIGTWKPGNSLEVVGGNIGIGNSV